MPTNEIPAVYKSSPWFIPGTTEHTAMAEQALTWLSDNPVFAQKRAREWVSILMKNPERMADWLLKQREHILDYRRRRAAFLALQPGDLVFCSCDMRDRPLSSCACNADGHPAFRENNSTIKQTQQ